MVREFWSLPSFQQGISEEIRLTAKAAAAKLTISTNTNNKASGRMPRGNRQQL